MNSVTRPHLQHLSIASSTDADGGTQKRSILICTASSLSSFHELGSVAFVAGCGHGPVDLGSVRAWICPGMPERWRRRRRFGSRARSPAWCRSGSGASRATAPGSGAPLTRPRHASSSCALAAGPASASSQHRRAAFSTASQTAWVAAADSGSALPPAAGASGSMGSSPFAAAASGGVEGRGEGAGC